MLEIDSQHLTNTQNTMSLSHGKSPSVLSIVEGNLYCNMFAQYAKYAN